MSFPSKETGPKPYKGQVLFPFPLICHPAYVRVISECRISHILSVNLGFFLPLVCFALLQWLTVLLHIYQTLVLHSFHSKNLPLAAIKGEQHQHFHLAAGKLTMKCHYYSI